VEIDNYPVVATYCPPAINTDNVTSHAVASRQRRTAHVRESQYCLQLVRCNDHQCCTPFSFRIYFRNDFYLILFQRSTVVKALSRPMPLFLNLLLNSMAQKEKMWEFIISPYELYCPSVEPHLSKRCCSVCGIYHASTKSATNHKSVFINQLSRLSAYPNTP